MVWIRPEVVRAKLGTTRRGRQGLTVGSGAKCTTDRVTSAEGDKKLTSPGKRDAIRRQAAELLKELKGKYRKFLDPVVEAFADFDSTGLPALRRPKDAIEAVERMRVEQSIRALSDKERVELLERSVVENDQLVLSVFFERASLHKLLSPEFIATNRREFMRQHAPKVADAELAGSVLAFDFRQVAQEFGLFAGPESAGDAAEILSHVAEVEKIGMAFEPNGDLRMMQSGSVPSNLPSPSFGADDEPATDSPLQDNRLKRLAKTPAA